MRQRDIFWFWLPLFSSWLLMTAEGPIVSAAINRLPNEIVMLAAMGIVTSLSVLIESPIINLLATSTALVKDRHTYLLVRRFTIHACIILTVVAALVAFTPLFDLIVLTLLNAPPEIARWVKPGMMIMVFWSAAIGWRRFLQGILIRHRQTRKIAWGTAIRLVSSGGTVILLGMWGQWPGVIIGSLALMAGVLAEALYTTIVVRPVIREQLMPVGHAEGTSPLTYGGLVRFHLPLAGTSVMILLVHPLVTSSLARLDQPRLSLAAWPILFQILLMARAAAFALPEAIIALYENGQNFNALRRFSYILTIVVTLFMILFISTGLSRLYIFQVQDMGTVVGELVLSSVGLFVLFPGLAVLASWFRGLLIETKATRHVNIGMTINLLITALILVFAVNRHWAGLPSIALALNLAAVAELLYLGWKTQLELPAPLRLLGRFQPIVDALPS